MKEVTYFLRSFRNDVFKLLPMKEAYDEGTENHIHEYLDSLITNAKGSMVAYPELLACKQYLYTINNLSYLYENKEVEFSKWRKIVLDSTQSINDLYWLYREVSIDEKWN